MSLQIFIIVLILAVANANSYGYAPSKVAIGTSTPAPAISHENVTVVEPVAVASEVVPGTKVNITTTTKRVNTTSETKESAPALFNVVPIEYDSETGVVSIDKDTLVPTATVITSYGSSGDLDVHQLDRVEELKTFDISMPGGISARLNAKNATDFTVDSKAASPVQNGAVGGVLADLAEDLAAEGKVNENATLTMSMANDQPVVSAYSTHSNANAEFSPDTSFVDLQLLANELGKASVLSPVAQTVAQKVNQTIATPKPSGPETTNKGNSNNDRSAITNPKGAGPRLPGLSVSDKLNAATSQPTKVPTPAPSMDTTSGALCPGCVAMSSPGSDSPLSSTKSSSAPQNGPTPSSIQNGGSSITNTPGSQTVPSTAPMQNGASSNTNTTGPVRSSPGVTISSSNGSAPTTAPSSGSMTNTVTPSSSNASMTNNTTPLSLNGSMTNTSSPSNSSLMNVTTSSPANGSFANATISSSSNGVVANLTSPSNGSTTNIPASSANGPITNITTPSSSNGSTTPSTFNGSMTPSSSNGSATPSSSNGSATPSSSNGSTTPSSSNGSMTPSTSNGSATPSTSNGSATPSTSNGSMTPSSSNGSTTPSSSNGSMTPSSSNGPMTSAGSPTLSSSGSSTPSAKIGSSHPSNQPTASCPGCVPSMGVPTPSRNNASTGKPGQAISNGFIPVTSSQVPSNSGRVSRTPSLPEIMRPSSFASNEMQDFPSSVTVMRPGSIINVSPNAVPSVSSSVNGSVPINNAASGVNGNLTSVMSNSTIRSNVLFQNLSNSPFVPIRGNMSSQILSNMPFLPIRACNKSYAGVSAEQINDFIESADRSGISIMSMATCQQIANYIANYPRPSVSTPEFCHMIGQRPSMPVVDNRPSKPVVDKRPSMPVVNNAAVNQDGFVWIMLPKLPVEVVELTESTVIHGALYADGSITSTGMSVASATSNVNGPLFVSIIAEDMIMTPIDDMKNTTSSQDSPLPITDEVEYEYPIGFDDDDVISPFFDESDDALESDMKGPISLSDKVRRTPNLYFEDKAIPESDMNEYVPMTNAAVRRTPSSLRYPTRS